MPSKSLKTRATPQERGQNSKLKTILLTGCAGFIGSNFIPYFLEKYPEYTLINLDLLTYAGDLENLKELNNLPNNSTSNIQHPTSQNDRYHFVHGNICDRKLVESIFKDYDIQGVIHFAAESHVDNSIKDPEIFIKTNINGTFNLIDVAYKHWMDAPFKYKNKYTHPSPHNSKLKTRVTPQERGPNSKLEAPLPKFHHISTDEVYGSLGATGLFTEKTPYAPNSPYSASKASSDMIVRSYHHTYGMNTIITNCSNNYGPKQHDEKLIPTIIRNAIQGNPIPIYGDGKNIRDWLYVKDHCTGIDKAYHKGKSGETYNIGGKNERDNLYIVNKVCEILDDLYPITNNSKLKTKHSKLESYKSLITFITDRAGHDRRYAIDATKIEKELKWKAKENFESGIIKTIKWYLNKYTKENNGF